MKNPKHPTLIRRHLQARLKKLHSRIPLLAASLVTIRRRCGRPGCHCRTGKPHPGFYLTCKQKGTTRTVYLPKDLLAEVKTWIRQYHQIKTLIHQISQLALAQVQTHVRQQRRRAGRS